MNPRKLEIIAIAKTETSPAVNYMFKVNNRNTRTMCEVWSKLTMETLNMGFVPNLKQARTNEDLCPT